MTKVCSCQKTCTRRLLRTYVQNPDLFAQHLQNPDLVSRGSALRLLSPGSAAVVVRNPDLVSRHHKISPGSATVVLAKPGLDILAPKSVTKIGPCNELSKSGFRYCCRAKPGLSESAPSNKSGFRHCCRAKPRLKKIVTRTRTYQVRVTLTVKPIHSCFCETRTC